MSMLSKLCVSGKTYKEIIFCIPAEGWVEFECLCYFYVDKGGMKMSQSEQERQKLGATLPVIKSAEENDFLQSLMKDNGNPWLGIEAPNGDNDLYWADGSSVTETFSAWNTGEPNYPGKENCAYMDANGDRKGKWKNNPCDSYWLTVCQKKK